MVLNVINIVVLRDARLKESSYTYLAGLAVADFCSLLMFGVNGVGRGHFPDQYGWKVFDIFVYFPVCLTTTSASVFLIVTVTVERFLFLYHPISSRSWCTRRAARRVVAVVWLVSVLVNIPRFFVFRITATGGMERTAFGASRAYHALTWSLFLLVAVGCGVALIVFNALLIRGIRRANEKRQSLKTSGGGGGERGREERREELRLTRTLVSVIFLYLLGELPSSLFSRLVFSAILGPDKQHVMTSYRYLLATCLATICAVSQHSLNFVFYCVFNKRFYRIFKTKCLLCGPQQPCGQHSELATIVDRSAQDGTLLPVESAHNGTTRTPLMAETNEQVQRSSHETDEAQRPPHDTQL